MSLRGVAAIVGVGELAPARETPGRTAMDLGAEVARQALADAGIGIREVDGLLVDPVSDAGMLVPSAVGEYLGLDLRFGELVDLGGASGAGMVARAAAAIHAGLCEMCLCVTVAPRTGGGFWGGARRGNTPALPEMQFEFPYGAIGANYAYALVATRYEHEFGDTRRARAKVAVDQRTNACANPLAIFHGKPITEADVLASPMVLDPLRLLEIVMPCGGGAALVVTSAARARKLRAQPAYLLGAGEHITHRTITYAPSLTTSPIAAAADRAFEMARVDRADVRLASIYDCYTITVLVSLEDAGFCKKGSASEFALAHDLTWKGDFPLNSHGGQLSFGQPGMAGGMSHVTEAARQVMGTASGRQISACDVAYVNGNGGFLSEQVSLVLARAL
jgi:acetyl-CoA acetyltransferase